MKRSLANGIKSVCMAILLLICLLQFTEDFLFNINIGRRIVFGLLLLISFIGFQIVLMKEDVPSEEGEQ